MVTHLVFCLRLPWDEKPGIKYMGSQRVDAIEHTRMFIIIIIKIEFIYIFIELILCKTHTKLLIFYA